MTGKSYAQIQYFVYKCLTKKDQRVLCLRQNLTDTKETIYQPIMDLTKKWGIYQKCKFNSTDKKITFPNGSVIFCKGLDDSESLKSLVVSDIWLEEATQADLASFNQLVLRLRGPQAKEGKVWLTFNPINKSNWVYQHFFDRDISSENIEIIKTTYLDNKFLSDKDKRQLLNFKKTNFAWYQVYALGDFNNLSTDGLFYNDFSADNNCSDISYNPSYPLHISFDENAVPYNSLIVSQIYQIKGKSYIRILKEYALFGKNLYYVISQFRNDFLNHKAGMFIYGDSTSQKKSVFLEKDQNYYSIIMQELTMFNPQKRVLPSNQSVNITRMYMNQIFRGDNETIDISIDYNCKELINDLENCKTDINGNKDKTIFNDKSRGMKYQKFGHLTDCLNYLVIQSHYQDYIKFKNGASSALKLTARKRRAVGY